MTRSDDFDFDIGLVTLTEYDADGFLGLQVDVYGEGASGCRLGEYQGFWGDIARPHDPDVDGGGQPIPPGACQALYFWDGGRLHVMPTQDPRVVPNLPKVKKGGRMVYGGRKESPAFQLFDGDDGSLTIYIPYALVGGEPTKAHVLELSASTETITVRHASGAGLSVDATGAMIHGPSASTFVRCEDGGVTIAGDVTIIGGLSVGGEGGIPLMNSAMTPCALVKGL